MDRLLRTPPSFWYFLSGVVASAGVNLLTGLASSTFNPWFIFFIVGSAFVWLVIAWLLAGVAKSLEAVLQEASLVINGRLSRSERTEIQAQLLNGVRRPILGKISRACALGALAIAFSIGASVAASRTREGPPGPPTAQKPATTQSVPRPASSGVVP